MARLHSWEPLILAGREFVASNALVAVGPGNVFKPLPNTHEALPTTTTGQRWLLWPFTICLTSYPSFFEPRHMKKLVRLIQSFREGWTPSRAVVFHQQRDWFQEVLTLSWRFHCHTNALKLRWRAAILWKTWLLVSASKIWGTNWSLQTSWTQKSWEKITRTSWTTPIIFFEASDVLLGKEIGWNAGESPAPFNRSGAEFRRCLEGLGLGLEASKGSVPQKTADPGFPPNQTGFFRSIL